MAPLWPKLPELDDLTPHIGEPGLPPAEAYPMRYPHAWPVMPIKNPLKDALWPTVDEPKGIPRDQKHPIGPWKEGQHRSWPGNMPIPKDQVPYDRGKHLPKHERYVPVDEIIDGEPYMRDPEMSIPEQHQRFQENKVPPLKLGKPPFGPFNPPPRNQG
mgnify:CR=1 FL=1